MFLILGKKDEMVEVLPLQRPHDTFNMGCGIRRAVGNRYPLDSHQIVQPWIKRAAWMAAFSVAVLAEESVIVPDEELPRVAPWRCLSDLLSRSFPTK